jgi:TolB-like protein/Flp pilus assembly protein TadD
VSLIAELQRRSVFKVGAAYLVVAWLAAQAAGLAFPVFEAPAWALRVFIFVLALGFPVALVLAWALEVTPEGIKVEAAPTGNKRVLGTAGALGLLAVAWFLFGVPAVRMGEGGASDGPRSLAVLPFAALGSDAESTGLAGGLHDTLITQLSRIKGLEVRSRTSVMKYKDWSGGLKPIAEELGVAVVLEGSVQRIGNRTVVNAQLIDARTDAHLWAETIDRSGDDLFALQADIAQRVAKALEIALSPAETQALTVAPTEDKEAYALFVEGMRVLNESGRGLNEQMREAMRLQAASVFEAAVARDPQFALAWATLARVYASIAWDTRVLSYAEYAAKTRAAAERAVALGPTLPEARMARGTVALQLEFDFPRAVQELTAAAEGMPSSAEVHERLGLALLYSGRWQDAAQAYERALALDPSGAYYYTGVRDALIGLRRFDDARALAKRVAVSLPGDYDAARQPAIVEAWASGDISPLLAFVRSASAGFRAHPAATFDQWYAAYVTGDFAAALAVLDRSIDIARPDEFDLVRADSLMKLGRVDEAKAHYAQTRDARLKELASPRDPYVEALSRVRLAYALAQLGDARAARENAAAADRLWGVARDPADGSRVWFQIAQVHVALGDHDEALRIITHLVEESSFLPAGRLWMEERFAELHADPRFIALMKKHGVDTSNEPFAFNRTPPAGGGK